MKTTTKIRWLLLLVTIGLFATSLTARWASTKLIDLNDIANDVRNSLYQKENKVYDYLSEKENIETLKSLDVSAGAASKVLDKFTSQNIYFQTFKKNKLVFWSDAIINAPNVANYKEGGTFLSFNNGWYEAIKRSSGDFYVIFFIPIKSHLPFTNQYLANNTDEFLINNPNIEIASLADSNVADIKTMDGRYLFSIKMGNSDAQIPYNDIEILMWGFGFFTLLLLINSISKFYADEGSPILATSFLTAAFILIRLLGLKYHFPEAIYGLSLFDPKIYASSFYFPSFADLYLNTITILWIVIFLHSYKKTIFKPIKNPWIGYPLLVYCVVFVLMISLFYSNVYFGIIFNSNINFKVSNLVNLNWLSYLGILLIMIGLLSYYLILDLIISFSKSIKIAISKKLIMFLLVFILYNIYEIFDKEYSVFFILVLALILIIGRSVYFYQGKMVFPALVIISFIFATIVSIKLHTYESYKELEVRKRLLQKLESANDPYAILSFDDMERRIVKDNYLVKILNDSTINDKELSSRINNLYLSGYLGKFAFKAYLYDKKDSLINQNRNVSIQSFKNLIESKSIKVTSFFYRLNNTFGEQNYFALIPLKTDSTIIGTLVLDLKSKEFNQFGAFPQLLQNGQISQQSEFLNYSYAFYQDKRLVNQSGFFIYDMVNSEFSGDIKKFIVLKKGDIDHVIYKPTANKTIVITHRTNTFWRELAALSFFFILFLVFAAFVVSYKWILKTLFSYQISFKNLRIKILASNNRLLYKTRIQVALVLAVVSSLLIIGIITFSYISIQYTDQQRDLLKNKIRIITSSFEDNISRNIKPTSELSNNLSFDDFSKMYNTDLNLFDINGKLLFSTQNKLYDVGLIADRINPIAYLNLHIKKKSEFIQDEHINLLSYTSAYMPVKNGDNKVIAYLQLPYFANQDDYNQKIGTFLNLLINIYVLVFVAISFFAFVVANQITSPLSLIQESISKTMIGRKNNPIMWKRNDEIGSLIKEYNSMIAALEDNATKLAQSERETAWREMAKQVAHEIKNPLTPLRLGIQMLDRSWKDKDERFDEKFLKFSKSFLEQIDSLSRIASEFSNFAKMPALKLENIELLSVLNRAIEVYSQMEHIKIKCNERNLKNCLVNVDKDQLLRSFNNLLKNAIEAMPEGADGEITISGKKLKHTIEIAVSDNGNGIPENLRESIFVPNFTTKSSGTGLGLAFVKQAIENVKGNIYFTTEIDVGTTFYITLPLVN